MDLLGDELFVDGSLRHAVTDSAAIADAQNMYLLFNQGVGGWAGDVTGDFESHFWIDSVKVWQIPSTGTDTTWKSTAGSGSWDTSGNWASGVPKFEDSIARFTANDNAAVNPTWSNTRIIGGLHFDTTTTAFTLGTRSGSLQIAKAASGAKGSIYMTQATSKPQAVASRVELYDGVTVTNNSLAADLTISGTIIGGGRLEKAGPGVLVLSASNTFTGGLGSIAGGSVGDLGTIRLAHSHAAGMGTVSLPASNASSIVVELAGGLDVPNPLTTAGRSSFTFLRNAQGTNRWSGDITITGLGGYAIDAASGFLRLGGTLSTTLASSSDRVFTFDGGGTGLVEGAVRDAATTRVGVAKQGSGTWAIASRGNTFSAGTIVREGTLVATASGALGTGHVAVEGGTLSLAAADALAATAGVSIGAGRLLLSATGAQAVTIGSLSIDTSAGGLLDLGGGRVTVASGVTREALAAWLMHGRGDGTWNGTVGITSAAAARDTTAGVLRTIGWMIGDAGDATIAYAAPGDSDLDGVVDLLDAANFLAGGKLDSATAADWTEGDFNGDTVVDIIDVADFLATGLFDAGPYTATAEPSVTAVPEPGRVEWLAAVILALAATMTAARPMIASPAGSGTAATPLASEDR